MKTPHTFGPWFVEHGAIFSEDDHLVCDPSAGKDRANKSLPIDTRAANADFIVQACNSHDALVAALQWLVDDDDVCEVAGDDAINAAVSALKLARGE